MPLCQITQLQGESAARQTTRHVGAATVAVIRVTAISKAALEQWMWYACHILPAKGEVVPVVAAAVNRSEAADGRRLWGALLLLLLDGWSNAALAV